MTALPLLHSSHDYPGPARRRHLALGAGVLLLHLALLYGWRHAQPPPLPDAGPKVESVAIWIRPLALKPPPPPVAKAEPKREPKPIRAASARPQPSVVPPAEPKPNAITLAPAATPADPLANTPAAETPKFDMAAALSTARKVAGERDPSKVGTALGQIPDKPLQTETQLARDIASGKRGDCRTAYAGAGLLAPLVMLLDKKDSGCKW